LNPKGRIKGSRSKLEPTDCIVTGFKEVHPVGTEIAAKPEIVPAHATEDVLIKSLLETIFIFINIKNQKLIKDLTLPCT
jgi:hypothetical protein